MDRAGLTEWAALGTEVLGALVIVAGVLRVAIDWDTMRFLLTRADAAAAWAKRSNAFGGEQYAGE